MSIGNMYNINYPKLAIALNFLVSSLSFYGVLDCSTLYYASISRFTETSSNVPTSPKIATIKPLSARRQPRKHTNSSKHHKRKEGKTEK